jgi:hypothetical protein
VIDVFKLGAALVFAAIAALTAIVAGLLSDARFQVVLGRAFCSFIVSGVVVYIGITLFDRLGYASIIHEIEESLDKMEEEGEDLEEEQDESEPPEDNAGEEEAEEEGFVPLQADSLQHVAGDEDE